MTIRSRKGIPLALNDDQKMPSSGAIYPLTKRSSTGVICRRLEIESHQPQVELDSKAALYIMLHLQTRPDLQMALGILVGERYYKLFATNACRVYQTKRIPWDTEEGCYRILCAWMWRLYQPDSDCSLAIEYTVPPTFTIPQDGKKHRELSVIYAGETIG